MRNPYSSKTFSDSREDLVVTGMHYECAGEATRMLAESLNPAAGVQTKQAFSRSARRLVETCRKRECALS